MHDHNLYGLCVCVRKNNERTHSPKTRRPPLEVNNNNNNNNNNTNYELKKNNDYQTTNTKISALTARGRQSTEKKEGENR